MWGRGSSIAVTQSSKDDRGYEYAWVTEECEGKLTEVVEFAFLCEVGFSVELMRWLEGEGGGGGGRGGGEGKAAFHSQLGVHFEGGEGGEDGGLVEGLF